eukprot:155420_1
MISNEGHKEYSIAQKMDTLGSKFTFGEMTLNFFDNGETGHTLKKCNKIGDTCIALGINPCDYGDCGSNRRLDEEGNGLKISAKAMDFTPISMESKMVPWVNDFENMVTNVHKYGHEILIDHLLEDEEEEDV